jgi:neutral trehalase
MRAGPNRIFWDPYFDLLDLILQGKWQLAWEIVERFVAQIKDFGNVPDCNGSQGDGDR